MLTRQWQAKEGIARNEYSIYQKQGHTSFCVTLSGLALHSVHPFTGSSPDGRLSCDCCSGFGCLEIKCPKAVNLTSCLDENHSYDYQVQSHMLVRGANYCDSYSWLDTNDSEYPLVNPELKPVLVRVCRNVEKQEEMV